MFKYDIIIPHYGMGRLTELCLSCLRSIRHYSQEYRLIFVDNGSPEFAAVEEELQQHPHLLIRNRINLGFVKAVNQGIYSSTAPFVVLLNNDTEVVSNWLDKLQAPLHGNVGLSGPLTTAENSWQGHWKVRGGNIHLLGPGRMLAFFAVMIRRDVFAAVGVLDEDFKQGLGDDDEFCARAEKAGFRLALAQNLTIAHHHRTTFKALYSETEIVDLQERAMKLFREKTCPLA